MLDLTGCELVLGLEDTTADEPYVEAPDLVALGETHGCAIMSARLYCWGLNAFGQLGVGGLEPSVAPRALPIDGSWRLSLIHI